METNIRFVNLNNKSRKGLYIYIKSEGSPSRYYKYSGSPIELEATKNYYEDRYVKKKLRGKSKKGYHKAYKSVLHKEKTKKRTPVRRQAEQYIAKLRKKKPLLSHIKKGLVHRLISNIHNVSDYKLNQVVKSLLKSLVFDKNILELVSTEENLRKLRSRFEHRVKVKDNKGKTLINANIFNKTPKEVKELLTKGLKKQEHVDGQDRSGSVVRKMKEIGFNVDPTGNTGNLNRIEVAIIFRRG